MSRYSVILFFSSTGSLWAARLLKKAGIDRRLVPIPRDLDHDCGFCVRISSGDADAVRDVLEKGGIEYKRIEELKDTRCERLP